MQIAYFALINPAPEPIFITEVEAQFGERTERYALPMGVVWEDEAVGNLPAQLAMARVRLGPRVGYLTDAFAIDGFTRAVLRNLRSSAAVAIEGGTLEFRPTSLMAALDLAEDAEIRRLSAEQSNSSLIVGDTLVMKVVRRVTAGVHPEGEITRFLTERGFGNTAPLYGEVVRVDEDGTPHTIGLVQGFVRNQGDGWGWTLEFLERTVDELSTTDGEAEGADDAFASYNVFAAAIGQRLGELHAVFSAPTDDPAFAPEPATPAVLEAGRMARSSRSTWRSACWTRDGVAQRRRPRRAPRRWPTTRTGCARRRARWRRPAPGRCRRGCTATSTWARCWWCSRTPT